MKRQTRAATVAIGLAVGGWACDGGTRLAAEGCEPGTVSCDGNAAVRCDPSGEEWLTIVVCPSPLVCRAGACVDPTPARCGDGVCDSTENCLLCATDCGCAEDTVCVGAECIPRASLLCGDGLCTADETCASCVEDCACAAGSACRGDTCVLDGSCGDTTCAATEDCIACPADCGCGAELLCRDRTCVPRPEPVLVAVLKSEATDFPTRNAWDDLSRDWRLFGDVPVRVDLVSLAFDGFGLPDLDAVAPDVVVIGDTWRDDRGWDLSAGEIEALVQYVGRGHGFVASGKGSLQLNPGLTTVTGVRLVALTTGLYVDAPLLLEHRIAGHPVLESLPDPIDSGLANTGYDCAEWEPAAVGECAILAAHAGSTEVPGRVRCDGIFVRIGGALGAGRSVLFTYSPDFSAEDGSAATLADRRLLYNAALWTAGRTD